MKETQRKTAQDRRDLDEMDRAIRELVENPPPEVIERMDRRLRELRGPERRQTGCCPGVGVRCPQLRRPRRPRSPGL